MPDVLRPILVVGGYGEVGRHVVSLLLAQGHMVVVAGRSAAKADALQTELGQPLGLSFRALDINVETADFAPVLQGIATVLMCVEQTHTRFVSACLQQGVCYVDISASDEFHQQVEALQPVAEAHQACAILSVGLAPGLTNLLVAQALQAHSAVKRLDVGILLGTGDNHGPQALQWTFERLFRPVARPSRWMQFATWGRRRVYPFAFSDQYALARTLSVSVDTYLCFSSRGLTDLLMGLRTPLLRRWQTVLSQALQHTPAFLLGNEQGYALQVEGFGTGPEPLVSLGLQGEQEALATAATAAAVAVAQFSQPMPVGIWHLHQVIKLQDIWPFVQRHGQCELLMPQ